MPFNTTVMEDSENGMKSNEDKEGGDAGLRKSRWSLNDLVIVEGIGVNG